MPRCNAQTAGALCLCCRLLACGASECWSSRHFWSVYHSRKFWWCWTHLSHSWWCYSQNRSGREEGHQYHRTSSTQELSSKQWLLCNGAGKRPSGYWSLCGTDDDKELKEDGFLHHRKSSISKHRGASQRFHDRTRRNWYIKIIIIIIKSRQIRVITIKTISSRYCTEKGTSYECTLACKFCQAQFQLAISIEIELS